MQVHVCMFIMVFFFHLLVYNINFHGYTVALILYGKGFFLIRKIKYFILFYGELIVPQAFINKNVYFINLLLDF